MIDRQGFYFQIVTINLFCVMFYHNLLFSWWRNEDWCIMLLKFCEITVNWLNDDDTPFKGEKAWKVLGNI